MGKDGDADFELKKFKSLQGRAREAALQKYADIKDNDILIVTTRVNSLPTYEIEKVTGDPLKYLFNMGKK
jgi:hypothetical protein